jgi:hypothetical protein
MNDTKLNRSIADPARAFETPEEVLKAPLTHREKVEILRRWEFDLRDLAVAEEENMGGGEDSALLPRVRRALRALTNDPEPSGPATKHGP